MSTPTSRGVDSAPRASASPPISGVDAHAPTENSERASGDHSTSAAAALIPVSLEDVRRIGGETAVVWAIIQREGHYDRAKVAAITGLRTSEVRSQWARLARYGYPLPEDLTGHQGTS